MMVLCLRGGGQWVIKKEEEREMEDGWRWRRWTTMAEAGGESGEVTD